MKPKNSFLFVLILMIFKFRRLYGQTSACNLNTIDHGYNICNTSNYLVYISESVCGTKDAMNCLCILVDNRDRNFDGQLVEIKMDNSCRVTWSRAIRTDLKNDTKEMQFKVTSGINRIFLQPFSSSSAVPRLVSFKIEDNEICGRLNRLKRQINKPFQEEAYNEPNDEQMQVVSHAKPSQKVKDNSDDQYRYLNDCIETGVYTANSERFCRNADGSDFVIEKRYFGRGERYWCIRVANGRGTFSSTNRLKITFKLQNMFLAWIPSDALLQKDGIEGNFHLGNRRTVIAVSANGDQLTDLKAVMIDGQSICNYFASPVTAPPPSRTTTSFYIPPSNTPPTTRKMVTDRLPVTPQREEYQTIKPTNKPTFNKMCGVKPAKRVTLISFGSNTNAGDWPWHAAIYKLQSKTNRNYICGGTLIDRKTIITAAHCVLDLNLVVIPERIIVELGRYDLSTSTPATQEFKVFDVIPHESYNPETIENDIAILVLANYVQLTSYVSFICLPKPNLNLQNQIGKTVGWGRDEHNQLKTDLQEASMPVIDNIVCLSSNREFFGNFLTKTNFCAGYRNNTNVCRGDSGGGLVFNFGNQWFLGGVTSLGVSSKSTEIECDISQYAVFTDVTKFVTWIKENS